MRMTLFVLAIASTLALASAAVASPFCDGYKTGYRQGFCNRADGPCADKLQFNCRVPDDEPGARAPLYVEGLLRGYADGRKAANPQPRRVVGRVVERRPSASTRDEGQPSRWDDDLECRMVCTNDIRDGSIESCTTQC